LAKEAALLAPLAGRIYDHAPQQNAFPLGGRTGSVTDPDRNILKRKIEVASAVLRRDWDPIGGGQIDLPADEYLQYAPRIVGMLERGAPDSEIVAELKRLEDGPLAVSAGANLANVARLLRDAVSGVSPTAT
jgi:hypothetical protein